MERKLDELPPLKMPTFEEFQKSETYERHPFLLMSEGCAYRLKLVGEPRFSEGRGKYYMDVKLLGTTDPQAKCKIDKNAVAAKIGETYAISVDHAGFARALEPLLPLRDGSVIDVAKGKKTSFKTKAGESRTFVPFKVSALVVGRRS
jgi:hypothetical protein